MNKPVEHAVLVGPQGEVIRKPRRRTPASKATKASKPTARPYDFDGALLAVRTALQTRWERNKTQ